MAATEYSVSLKKENAHDDPIYCCVWTQIYFNKNEAAAPTEIIATAGLLGQIKLWEWKSEDNSMELMKVLKDHILAVTSLSISPNGEILVSTAMDFKIIIWDLVAGEKVHKIEAPNVWRATFSPDGSRIIAGCHDGNLVVYDVAQGNVVNTYNSGHKFIVAIAWCPKDKYLASGSTNGIVCVYESAEYKTILTIRGQEKSIKNVAFSPNSKLLATSCIDGSFSLYEVETGKFLHSLQQPSWSLAVCFCPDGQRLALSTGDGEVILASTDGLQVLKTFKEHEGEVWELQFNKKGDRLVSVGKDKSLNMYEIPPLPKTT